MSRRIAFAAAGVVALGAVLALLPGAEPGACYHVTALDTGAGRYVRQWACADSDGGLPLPPGLVAVEVDTGGEDWPCACASGPACERALPDGGWGPAPRDTTLQPGRWRGECVRKACTELAGVSSMPRACR